MGMSLKKNLDVIVYEHLWEKIIRGQWVPGQMIAVDELAEEYGVSRTPILQALRRMNANRMITITNTGHHLVPQFTEKNVRDLVEMRLLLELQAVQDIAASSFPIPIEELRTLASTCASFNSTGDTFQTRLNDLRFHRKLVECAGNSYLCDLYERIQGQFMVANYLITSHTAEQQRVAADDHLQIVESLETGNFALAEDEIREHILGALNKMLNKMKA